MTPRRFRSLVYTYRDRHGRHDLPWRRTTEPYHILVSEIMLQQTQVDRVVVFYERFLEKFPTIDSLARAPLGDVLRLWQGLGYNRRAKMLHACAGAVVKLYGGRMPDTYTELLSLPGVGPYTAGAVMAFAYNQPVVMIETNIRAAHIHHFFPQRDTVHDSELMPLIEKTLDLSAPRVWYGALMDYGSYLKRAFKNPSRRSIHHTKQSTFKGSDREIRGALLRAIAEKTWREESLIRHVAFERRRVTLQLAALESEGLVVRKRGVYTLP